MSLQLAITRWAGRIVTRKPLLCNRTEMWATKLVNVSTIELCDMAGLTRFITESDNVVCRLSRMVMLYVLDPDNRWSTIHNVALSIFFGLINSDY